MRPFNQYQGPAAKAASQSPGRQPELLPQQPAVHPDQFADAQASVRRNEAALMRSTDTESSYPRTDFPGYQSVGHRSHDGVRNERGQGPGFKTSYQDNRRSVMDSQLPVEAGDSAIQLIGTRRFRLNYGIDAIDPSGVARVDLWMTRDGGQTWNSWGNDPDNTSPFPVEVQEEGRYGFRIVVHSKDGLTGRGPSSGDEPDIWVQVDTESPLAQITSVPYGRGDEAGRLVINYSVADPHLVLRPVTLAYSRNPEGPWTAIDQGLRNEGRYVWKPSSNVPDRIFLRLDAAGLRGQCRRPHSQPGD